MKLRQRLCKWLRCHEVNGDDDPGDDEPTMAQTRTAKGTIASKTSGTTLTIPNISMIGGDAIIIAVGWDSSVSANPGSVQYAGRDLDFVEGKTTGTWRCRVYQKLVYNTKTRDAEVIWPTANTTKVMIATSIHQASKWNLTGDNENLANTASHTGLAVAIDHINTLHMGFHMTNGPSGDLIGTSSTGHTLGQRVGTTGDADTTNVTLQETYKIIEAQSIGSGLFVIGDSYQIRIIGTTDFTAIGAASNTIGLQFVATGVGSGTGEAYHLEATRSRLTGLTLRDHLGIMAFFIPKNTFTINEVVQHHRNMNENPDWVVTEVEVSSGQRFRFRIDPDDFDAWSDQAYLDLVAKRCATWETNIIDSNLTYEADSTRDTRMDGFVDTQVIL